MTTSVHASEEALFERIAEIVEASRARVSRSVNTTIVHAYWFIGRELVEVQQEGKERAEYGEGLIQRLAKRLSKRYGKGFSYPSVKRMKQFYLTYPQGSAISEGMEREQKGSASMSLFESAPGSLTGSAALSLLPHSDATPFPPLLSWTHYLILMKVKDPQARAFYEIEAARENWATRELERQVASMLFERLTLSRDKDKVLALAKEGQQVATPRDVIKDPMVLEFLELQESPVWLERDLEQAIINRLEAFLLELGKGFCFVGRQKRITLDGDHFYVDLVFFNRLLRCFVLIDLKLGKLTHQDLGQMQMYVNYFDRFQRVEGEAPTAGIVLCSEKNDAMVCITLPEGNEQILASRYQLYLPTEEQLRDELVTERERIEQARRLSDSQVKGEPEETSR
jgi:predicted nuclease of restriction endonuclease-like (RecB) superfamily